MHLYNSDESNFYCADTDTAYVRVTKTNMNTIMSP